MVVIRHTQLWFVLFLFVISIGIAGSVIATKVKEQDPEERTIKWYEPLLITITVAFGLFFLFAIGDVNMSGARRAVGAFFWINVFLAIPFTVFTVGDFEFGPRQDTNFTTLMALGWTNAILLFGVWLWMKSDKRFNIDYEDSDASLLFSEIFTLGKRAGRTIFNPREPYHLRELSFGRRRRRRR